LDRTDGTGQLGQGRKLEKTVRIVQPGQTESTGWPENDSNDRTAGTGQKGRKNGGRTVMTGQSGHDIWAMTTRTGQPGQVKLGRSA
jgi:hypothetical protein